MDEHRFLHEDTNTVFVLPEATGLGGVTSWSLELSRQMHSSGRSASILAHEPVSGVSWKMPAGWCNGIRFVRCPSKHHPNDPFLRPSEIRAYLPAYLGSLPAIFIPNWSHGAYAACALLAQADSTRMRVIGIAHADGEEYYQLLVHYEPMIHRFVAVSDVIAERLVWEMPHRERDIRIMPYPIHFPSSVERTYADRSGPIRLVYAGRLVQQQKRVFDLVPALEALYRRGVDFRLNIVGEGAEAVELERRIRALEGRSEQRIRFVGLVAPPDMTRVWSDADVCVSLSDYEGMSLSLLEAMAHGCVPVVSRVSGTSMVIEPGVNGFYFSPGDTDRLAEFVSALAADRGKLREMGCRARQVMAGWPSYERYAEEFSELLRTSCRSGPRAWPRGRPLVTSALRATALRFALAGLDERSARLVGRFLRIAPEPVARWLCRAAHRMRGLGRNRLGRLASTRT